MALENEAPDCSVGPASARPSAPVCRGLCLLVHRGFTVRRLRLSQGKSPSWGHTAFSRLWILEQPPGFPAIGSSWFQRATSLMRGRFSVFRGDPSQVAPGARVGTAASSCPPWQVRETGGQRGLTTALRKRWGRSRWSWRQRECQLGGACKGGWGFSRWREEPQRRPGMEG